MTGFDIIVLLIVGVAAIGGFVRGFVQEAMRLIAGRMGKASRNSALGPIDRVLGFGFGAVKGAIVVVFAFSLLVLGYDTVWGPAGRPTWMTTARTYTFVDASADALVQLIRERQFRLNREDQAIEGRAGDEP